MSFRIALAGNPNSGKTTLFNALTGSHQYVGNWPGVTVEKKEGSLKTKHQEKINIIDLPGIYSLSPYSAEEIVTRDYLLNQRPDVIVNIVDATNIERNLYLTSLLIETRIPVIVALNMMDILDKNKQSIDTEALSEQLHCPVIAISALKEKNITALIECCLSFKGTEAISEIPQFFSHDLENVILKIESILEKIVPEVNRRFIATKLFERDELISKSLSLSEQDQKAIETLIEQFETKRDDDAESLMTHDRYQFIARLSLLKHNEGTITVSLSDKIDRIVTNRWLALPIFAIIMYGIYYVSIQTVGDWTIGYVEEFFAWVGTWMTSGLAAIGTSETLISLLVDGALGGVTSVMTFVPQMMILFFFISLLEDSGYMARIAFIMDRIFRRFGLSGKSFIPFIVGTGCSVPAIMASRTIENEKDRKMTIILTPFIPCSAKLPVFALMIGAFFPDNAWVGPSMYFIGILMVIFSGILLKHTKWFKGDPAPFVMELPTYKMPSFKSVLIHMFERGKSFIVRAGTLIFTMSVLIWISSNLNWTMQLVDQDQSILADLGKIVAPIFAPLGYGFWQAAVAQVTGLLAKETMVSTFGILMSGLAEATEESSELLVALQTYFTVNSAYAFMLFTLLAAPCMAAIGATKRELVSWKETLLVLGYQCGLAYLVSLIAYQIHLFEILNTLMGWIGHPIVLSILALILIIGCFFAYFKSDTRKLA